jgi:hypothetical protein
MLLDSSAPQHHVGFNIVVIQGRGATREELAIRRQTQRVEMHNIEIDRGIPVRRHPASDIRLQPSDAVRMDAHETSRCKPRPSRRRTVKGYREELDPRAIFTQMLARPLKPFLHVSQQVRDDLLLHKSQQVHLVHTSELPNQVVTSLQHPEACCRVRHEVGKP